MAVKFPVVNIANCTSLFSIGLDVSKEITFKRQNHALLHIKQICLQTLYQKSQTRRTNFDKGSC